MILGIDTGTNTGLAYWNTDSMEFEKLVSLSTYELVRTYEHLNDVEAVVIEDPTLDKAIFYPKRLSGDSFRKSLSLAQDIGKLKAYTQVVMDYIDKYEIPMWRVPPSKRDRMRTKPHKLQELKLMRLPTKLHAEGFKYLTGCKLKSNEHTRDAAMLVFGLDIKKFNNYKLMYDYTTTNRKRKLGPAGSKRS